MVKEGDTVRIIGNGHPVTHYLRIGSIAKVTRGPDDDGWIDVKGRQDEDARRFLYQTVSKADYEVVD